MQDQGPKCAVTAGHGPWRPFLAPLLANERVTAAGHERDTRLLLLGLRGSGLACAPGDLAAILPAQVLTLYNITVYQCTCPDFIWTRKLGMQLTNEGVRLKLKKSLLRQM